MTERQAGPGRAGLLLAGMATLFMVAFAVTTTMFGTLLPMITADYGLSYGRAGLFAVFMGAGSLAAMPVTGLFGDRLPKTVSVGVIFLLMGAVMAAIYLRPAFWLLLGLVTLLNALGSMLNLMVTALFSDLFGEGRAKSISLLHLFYGLGSLAGPAYPMLVCQAGLGWQATYLWAGVFYLGLGVLYFLLPAAAGGVRMPAPAGAGARAGRLGRDSRVVAMCALSFLFMGGYQSTFATWSQTYLQSPRGGLNTAAFTSLCMTVYWVGMVGSRLAGAWLSQRVGAGRLLAIAGAAGGATLLVGYLAARQGGWVAVMLLLGLCTGAVYPLLLSYSCGLFPQSPARISSLIGIFSSFGTMLFGWLVGLLFDAGLPGAAVLIPVAAMALSVLVVWRWLLRGAGAGRPAPGH